MRGAADAAAAAAAAAAAVLERGRSFGGGERTQLIPSFRWHKLVYAYA